MPNTEEVYELRGELHVAVRDLEELTKKVDTILDVLGQQATIIRSFEDEKQRDIGSKGTIKFLWGIIATGVASIAYNLHDIILFLFPPKIH